MRNIQNVLWAAAMLLLVAGLASSQELAKPENSVRIATYNVALNRAKQGELSKELESGESRPARAIAEVIQIVRPDILLINELDYDDGKSARLLAEKYLAVGQNNEQPIKYEYHFTGPVNTGVDSGLDLDRNKKLSEPTDAFGFGNFPGQYGMVVYSNAKIDPTNVRSFQNFLWKDMPAAALPVDPKTNQNYYLDSVLQKFRLSSKSHWDVPIQVGDKTIHLLASHPTPPVFDGDEDKNGCRNHDEIRIWADYVADKANYLYDDSGTTGGLAAGSHFAIVGDLNADPLDGQSRDGAIDQLLQNELVNSSITPQSTGGKYWSQKQAGRNANHTGNPLHDTGDFDDPRVGNMRVDYVLPSKTLNVVNSGVFWPKPDETGIAAAGHSDHRLVWIDIEK